MDGVATAAAIKKNLAARVATLAARGVTPGLGTLLVGEDFGSTKYVAGKHRDCAEVGIASIRVDLPGDASEAEIRAAIERLNENPACTGYIVQLPLPKGIDAQTLAGVRQQVFTYGQDFSIKGLVPHTGISRVSLKKYLDYMQESGEVTSYLIYPPLGRPVRLYRVARPAQR